MRVVMFYHSLLSCWNHGNAHFLRGVATELISRGHRVSVWEAHDNWSLANLLREHGREPIDEMQRAYPLLHSNRYQLASLDLDRVLDGADLVLVHEWNEPELVARIGEHHRRNGSYVLLFHDTHHRAATDPSAMATYDLSDYDGVLAFGEVIRELYLQRGWAQRAWTWHEAADVRLFRPIPDAPRDGDLVWVGNWGDDERSAELRTFLLQPIRDLRLRAQMFGVRYPPEALAELQEVGAVHRGWLPNHRVPQTFARFRVTVHVPRRPYTRALPGIPTIRPFEALACGIPLVSAPWDDAEGLFEPGRHFLVAHNTEEMKSHLWSVLNDQGLARGLVREGRRRILERHTCGHRVDELLAIVRELRPTDDRASATAAPAQDGAHWPGRSATA